MSFLFGNRSSKTFKPKKNIPEGSKQHELMQHAAATLGSGFDNCFLVLFDFPGHIYRPFFYWSALKNDQVTDYIINPIEKVLSVRNS